MRSEGDGGIPPQQMAVVDPNCGMVCRRAGVVGEEEEEEGEDGAAHASLQSAATALPRIIIFWYNVMFSGAAEHHSRCVCSLSNG